MICQLCKKEAPDRMEIVNGHTYPATVCEPCKEKKIAEYKAYPPTPQWKRKEDKE